MSRTVKIVLYILCLVGVVVFSTLTMKAYRDAAKSSEQRKESINRLTSSEPTNAPATDATNAIPAVDPATNAVPPGAETNAPSETNVQAAATNTATKTDTDTAEAPVKAGVAARGYTRMVTYGLGLLLSVIGLAVLIGYDVSHFVAHRAQDMLFADDGAPANPEYERAEQLWADGQYLDAVRAMREYLEKNPREQYVALRIAEIYEENLNNPLAAALEYEEVLKKKLPAERWGWAAIHLANIYSGKLGKSEAAVELLRRIYTEYGHTAAAKKARERLAQIDPEFIAASDAAEIQAAAEAAQDEPPPPPPPASNLPPGFRPKT